MDLDKAVLIVGATKGLGRTLAIHFNQVGYFTYTVGLGPLNDLSTGRGRHFDIDIGDPAALKSCVASIQHALDGVIFCQRYRGDSPMQGELTTSVVATHQFIEALKPRLVNKYCSILLVGSVLSDFVSLEMDVSYHVCKAAIAQMAKYYSVALADKAAVNCLQLGTFIKPETECYFADDMDFFKDLSPQNMVMHTRDLACVFEFFVEQKPRFISGQTITIDGGITNQWIEAYAKARLK